MKKQKMIAGAVAVVMGLMMAVTTIEPITAFAADDTIVYITNNGIKYHRQDCRTISKETSWGVTTAEARAQGRTACKVCVPDDYFVSTVTTTTTTPAATTAPVTTTAAETATPTAPSATAASITPAEAVQQAFALYVQNGLDTNTAFARVQAITAQLAVQPDNYAQFVQADLTAMGK